MICRDVGWRCGRSCGYSWAHGRSRGNIHICITRNVRIAPYRWGKREEITQISGKQCLVLPIRSINRVVSYLSWLHVSLLFLQTCWATSVFFFQKDSHRSVILLIVSVWIAAAEYTWSPVSIRTFHYSEGRIGFIHDCSHVGRV